MKVREYITINDAIFRIVGTTNTKGHVEYDNNYNEIYQVYGRPSRTKVAIWQDWCKWANESGAHLAIESHNSYSFTIRGNVEYNGKLYQLYITNCYNRAYEVI